jgi:hypothetical protein
MFLIEAGSAPEVLGGAIVTRMGRDRSRARSSGRLDREIERDRARGAGRLKPLCLPPPKRFVDADHPGRPASSIFRHPGKARRPLGAGRARSI